MMAMRWLMMVGGTAAYLALAIWGAGGFAPFFSRTPLIALTVVFFAIAVAAVFAGGGVTRGEREDRSNRWVLYVFVAVGLALGFVPAYTDRIGFWTIDGEAIRWLGVVLFGVGGALRIWPVYVLGNRFSGLVAIQRDHRLMTTGIYGIIRHPSYAGLLINCAGWSLAFRSGLGLVLTAIMVFVILARIRSEERLLLSHFGAEYEAYRARTSRLIPGIY
ncbi:MAG: isoprenylcysteine carboxylmethyltransferase family protein [Candidatus Eremiobacteraeota bacterium]|nr:isoprenylcysteine carboxylmethyltransferase family protein [Candidatus Eremiobacteraeota bacterium]